MSTKHYEKPDAFEAYEQLPAAYHKDPRWDTVREMRENGQALEANSLVFRIRNDYGFEY